MEKRLYELKINEALEHVMPPLQEMELTLLTQSLLTEGCRDSLVIWKETGELVDGHNRYRICQENNIPFKYIDMSFEDETAAKHWIIKNQLSRRNVPPFVRCELVLPLEEELKAEAKKRQIRKPTDSVVPTLALQNNGKTRDELAQMAGVSHGTMDKARKLAESADEETKEKLRSGNLSIHRAFTNLKKKPDEPVENKTDELIPGHTVEQILGSEKMGYKRPSDDVYNIPPIKAYGMMPAENMVLRGRAEMAQAKGALRKEMENHIDSVSDILRKMTRASINEENIATLRQIITAGNNQIEDLLNEMMEGYEDEEKE